MNANPPQQYPTNYYVVPERKVSSNVKLLQPNFEIKPSMDLCNLYIRGLKPEVTSIELFNIFKPFGRIISARVMEDSSNNCKAGFGFVSFSSSIEAAEAMININVEQSSVNKYQENEKKDEFSPIMTVRFHEPRLPRPEHNYNQQLELLSNSRLRAHFYTRQKQKVVPLKPTEDHRQQVIVSILSPDSENYAHLANTSPVVAPYFPVNSHGSHYYYIPSYWTHHQGTVYTNYAGSHSQPTSSQYHQFSAQQQLCNSKKSRRHSCRDTTTPITEIIPDKLLELLKKEYNITPNNNPELITKLMKLSRIEQSNCLNNSVYFKKKMSLLIEGSIDEPRENK